MELGTAADCERHRVVRDEHAMLVHWMISVTQEIQLREAIPDISLRSTTAPVLPS